MELLAVLLTFQRRAETELGAHAGVAWSHEVHE